MTSISPILARGTPGFSGADLANMVNEAALLAARQNRKTVLMYDFELAKDKVLMGAERKSMILTDEEKKNTAYHEGGHALVAAKVPHADPLHKVTIIPRGMALGVTMQLPIDDKHTYDRVYLESQLAIMMGGRVAEEIFLKTMTTGAGNDIERATEIARKMVCEWGMSQLGPLTFGKKEEQIFLGRELSQHRDYSEETAREIDAEVRRFIDSAYKTAFDVLDGNRDVLERIAQALLEREVLDSAELQMIIQDKHFPPACCRRRPMTPAASSTCFVRSQPASPASTPASVPAPHNQRAATQSKGGPTATLSFARNSPESARPLSKFCFEILLHGHRGAWCPTSAAVSRCGRARQPATDFRTLHFLQNYLLRSHTSRNEIAATTLTISYAPPPRPSSHRPALRHSALRPERHLRPRSRRNVFPRL